MDWSAVAVTLKLAMWTTSILLVLGLPLAYWLAFSTRRWKPLVEVLVAMPLLLPPTVIGFYVLLATGPQGPLGPFCERLFGRTLPFTFPGIVVGSVLFNLPFAVRPFAAALSGVDRRLIEASWCLGAGKLRTFFRVILPLSRAGIVAGAMLTFAHTVGEFGVVLMVGGAIPDSTRTISIVIYDRFQALEYDSAHATSAALLAFSFLVLVSTYALGRRVPTV